MALICVQGKYTAKAGFRFDLDLGQVHSGGLFPLSMCPGSPWLSNDFIGVWFGQEITTAFT